MREACGGVLAGKAGQDRDVDSQNDQRQFHRANLRHRNVQQVGKSKLNHIVRKFVERLGKTIGIH
jgi:hypothetical protein